MSNNRILFHIGMRKVKSLLAIVIGFIIWQAIRLVFPDLEFHPMFIYLYAFLEIRDTSEKTKSFGVKRIKATAIAIAIGLPMLLLRIFVHTRQESETMTGLVDLAMILVGVLVILQLGERFDCGAITGLTAAIYIVFLLYHADDGRYLYAAIRAAQTIIGVLVAWFVNVLLFPYPGKIQ